ncbi:hypothetical protein V6N13_010184 [Hibiscus sabdariffa]
MKQGEEEKWLYKGIKGGEHVAHAVFGGMPKGGFQTLNCAFWDIELGDYLSGFLVVPTLNFPGFCPNSANCDLDRILFGFSYSVKILPVRPCGRSGPLLTCADVAFDSHLATSASDPLYFD